MTLAVQDVTNETIEVTDTGLKFTGVSGSGQAYETDLTFFEEIDASKSSWVVRPRQVEILVMRKEEGEHWPRLTKEKVKAAWLQADWSKYVDPDEEDEVDDSALGDFGMGGGMGGMGGPGGMDLSQLMASMGGAGGAGGMDFSSMMGGAGDDSDDDAMPELDDDDDGPPPLEDE